MSEKHPLMKLLLVGAGIFGFSQAEAWLRAEPPPPPQQNRIEPSPSPSLEPEPIPIAPPRSKRRRRRRPTEEHPPSAKLPSLARSIPDRLSDAAIRRMVATRRAEIAACYRRGQTERLDLELTIQPSGRVSRVETDGVRGSGCAARRIKRWRFPKFRGEPRRAEIAVILAGGT